MLTLITILFTILATATCSNANPLLQARACTFSCPATDLGYYPIGIDSGPNGNELFCTYPSVSYCQYSAVTGTLTYDVDAQLCPHLATCTGGTCTCPAADLGDYVLGGGSGAHGSILFCSYPTASELSSTSDYCDYSLTTGSLVLDNDFNFCPGIALQQGSCAITTTPVIVTVTPTITVTPTQSKASSFVPVSSAQSSAGHVLTSTNHTIPIAVGSAIGGVAFLAACAAAIFLLLRRDKARTVPNLDLLPHTPMSAAPLYPGGPPNWPGYASQSASPTTLPNAYPHQPSTGSPVSYQSNMGPHADKPMYANAPPQWPQL